MDRIVDEIFLFALCLLLAFMSNLNTFGVVSVLVAVIVVCVCEIVSSFTIRGICLVLFFGSMLFFPALTVMAPLAVYECVAQRSRIVRVIWIPFLVAIVLIVGWQTCLSMILLSIAAALIATRTGQKLAENHAMRRMRDGLREQLNDAELEAAKALQQTAVIERGAGIPQEECTVKKMRRPALEELTDREQIIASFVAEGLDNKEIAAEMYLSEGTVRNHISAILQKCHLKNRTQIAIMYLTELYA